MTATPLEMPVLRETREINNLRSACGDGAEDERGSNRLGFVRNYESRGLMLRWNDSDLGDECKT